MIHTQDFKDFFKSNPLNNELIKDYDTRQSEAVKQNYVGFSEFLGRFNEAIFKSKNPRFSKTLYTEIVREIYKDNINEDLITYFNILVQTAKPKTTDIETLSSLNWQINQMLNPSYSELSYEEKFVIIFHIIFSKFNERVQKQFIKLLKRCKYNSSMDLLELMTLVNSYHSREITFEQLKGELDLLLTVNNIEERNGLSFLAHTKYGEIELFHASDSLEIKDASLLEVGKCHYAVSTYLKEFPNLFGAYYYIPNYFAGYIEHSVLIDYQKKYVYDLSHNIRIPLEYFIKYYNKVSFTISGYDFIKLYEFIKKEYNSELSICHLEEVRRRLIK